MPAASGKKNGALGRFRQGIPVIGCDDLFDGAIDDHGALTHVTCEAVIAEASHLLAARPAELSAVDRIRRLGWPAPFLVVGYVLIAKGALLDGRAGWFYAFQRLCAEVLLALELLDRRLSANGPKGTGAG